MRESYDVVMQQVSIHIVLRIDVEQPIELHDFVLALTALANQYGRFIHTSHPELHSDARIFIHELRPGSIIADLVPLALILIEQMDRMIIIEQFIRLYGSRLSAYFRTGGRVKEVTRSELNDFMNTVKAIANDQNGSGALEAVVYESGEVRAALKFNTKQARTAIREIEQHKREMEDRDSADHKKVMMTFYQSNLKDIAKSGEMVVIEAISEKPRPLVYASDLARQRVKSEIMFGNRNVYKLGFFVDVDVETLQGRPVAYRLVNVHDVIELPED